MRPLTNLLILLEPGAPLGTGNRLCNSEVVEGIFKEDVSLLWAKAKARKHNNAANDFGICAMNNLDCKIDTAQSNSMPGNNRLGWAVKVHRSHF